jgi:hypothetical protein
MTDEKLTLAVLGVRSRPRIWHEQTVTKLPRGMLDRIKAVLKPSESQMRFLAGATGRLALSCLGSSTMTLPPQQSTVASMPSSEQTRYL